MKTEIEKVKDLVTYLNQARNAYYNDNQPIMTDYEYDNLFDELQRLEQKTNIIMANSPTQQVGYEVKSKLEKVQHNHPMLSLDKTKSVEDLIKFAANQNCLLMLKMDGLTISLEYNDGVLTRAESRGDGLVGEDLTHNALVIKNIPKRINHKGKLTVDGEAIITYGDFKKNNSKLEEKDKYKNPRNLVSGSIRQLDSKIAEQRNIKFIAWKCIEGCQSSSHLKRLMFLKEQGFDIVPLFTYTNSSSDRQDLPKMIESLRNEASRLQYPIDGCVMGYDNIEYGASLGATNHHLRSQIAYKFYDEEVVTKLTDVEWTMGKTGVLTPTAVFDTVEIDDTSVSRASLHNISIVKQLQLGIGDEITVVKANQIIPQIKENLTKSNTLQIPTTCPICGEFTEIKKENKSEVLYCSNPNCKGKLLGKFVNFCSKPAMDIEGLSEATLEKFINKGYLKTFIDIYHLDKFGDEIINSEGFGVKSWYKIWNAIQTSRDIKLENFLVALGIPNIGKTASKTISKYCNGDFDTFIRLYENNFDWTSLQDFGIVLSKSINDYLNNMDLFNDILYTSQELRFITNKVNQNKENPFTNKTVVVTGSLQNFSRSEIQSKLEELGAKVSNSISKKTDYLICGENAGSKLAKAKDLNITILFEKEFLELIK